MNSSVWKTKKVIKEVKVTGRKRKNGHYLWSMTKKRSSEIVTVMNKFSLKISVIIGLL